MWPVASCVTLGETLETIMSKLISIINALDTNPTKLTDFQMGEVMLLILLRLINESALKFNKSAPKNLPLNLSNLPLNI